MHDKKEVTFEALSQESTCGLRFVSVPVSDGNDFCDYYIVQCMTSALCSHVHA